MKKIRPHMSKHDDTSTGTATRAIRCGLLLGGLRISYAQARWTQWIFTWFGPLERNTLHPREIFVLLCVLRYSWLSWTCPVSVPAQAFYSSRPSSHIESQGPTTGPGWLKPYTVWFYRLDIANDIFNDVEYVMSCYSAMLRSVSGMATSCQVVSHCSYVLWAVNRAGAAL
jgi:hypothetical protein